MVSQAQSQAVPLSDGRLPLGEAARVPEVAAAPEASTMPRGVSRLRSWRPPLKRLPSPKRLSVFRSRSRSTQPELEVLPVLQEQVGESLRMTMSSGAPNQYFFRGLLQSDKGFLWQSNSNLDVALYDSKEFKLIIPVGFWFSVHPGDKAKTGKGPAAWYESRLSGGIAAEGQAYRADLRLVVYSSPNGSFEDVYELLLKLDLFDDVVFAKGSDTAFFAGSFPRSPWRTSSRGRAMGETRAVCRVRAGAAARLLASKDVWIDAVVPLAIGLGLSKYYQLVDRGDTTPTNHVLGLCVGRAAVRHRAALRSRRLGMYNILPSLTVLLPTAAKDAQPHVDSGRVRRQDRQHAALLTRRASSASKRAAALRSRRVDQALSSPMMDCRVLRASPSTIIVFGWTNSSFSMPRSPGSCCA